MSTKILVREREGVFLIDISGRLTLGYDDPSVQDVIRRLIDNGSKHIILNLSDVGYVDSSGLGQLVGAYATAASRGASIKLLNLNDRVYNLMQITKLYTVFDIYSSEETAIQSFHAPAGA